MPKITSKTVKVRVKILVDADGNWAGHTYSADPSDDEMLYDMMGDEFHETAVAYYLVADVPVPQPTDIAASVEPAKSAEPASAKENPNDN